MWQPSSLESLFVYPLIPLVYYYLLHIILFYLHTYHEDILINSIAESFIHIMKNC